VALVAAILALATGTEASTILFTDRAAFNAAVGEADLFTSFAAPSCGPHFCTLNVGPLEIANTFVLGGDTVTFFTGSRFSLGGVFREPVSAFGFDLVSVTERVTLNPRAAGAFEFETSAGERVSIQIPVSTFVGISLHEDTLLSFVAFGARDDVEIDNLAIQSVPEPGTWLLVSAAVPLLVLRRRRRPAAAVVHIARGTGSTGHAGSMPGYVPPPAGTSHVVAHDRRVLFAGSTAAR
jgi:hypothetical protein